MASRMDKYKNQMNSTNSSQSRLSKNQNLYEKLYTNKIFTEFNNADFDNVVDLNKVSNSIIINKREQYKNSKILNLDDIISEKDDNYNISSYDEEQIDKKEKNYNINDILENARKNRKIDDETEKKRRLKSVEYSILSDLSQEKIKEYHENKQKKLSKEEEENLEELIHTITSNSLRKKIDDELLSDLLPREESETVISKELFDQIEEMDEKTREIKNEIVEEDEIDNSFYTKSMDLSKEDFIQDLEEDYSFLEEKKMSIFSKIMITLLIIIVISIIIYVIYRFI